MPYLDRSSIPGGARYRPFYRILFIVFSIDVVVLAYVGAKPPEGMLIPIGQFATFMYFGLFALLPVISRKEEAWLLKRGLPPKVQELVDAEVMQRKQRAAEKMARRKK